MPLSTSYLKARPIITAVVEDYIVENGLANHLINFAPQAYEPANKKGSESIDAGELSPNLTRH
jgi:hypothetical protein